VTHRDDAALADEADDRVVGARPAGGRVDDDEDVLVLGELERARGEHGVDVGLAEDLLQRVEREARELRLDEVRAVLRAKKRFDTDVSMWLHHSAMNLLELQRKSEALKLRLFWTEHSPEQLNAAMSAANKLKGGPQCYCFACSITGRYEGKYPGHMHQHCTFKDWFEQMLTDHEMSIGCGTYDAPFIDHHFSNLSGGLWLRWTYGSRLWKATSVRDPELAKLERLFKTLDTLDDTGKNKRVTSKKTCESGARNRRKVG
jgi:hypothetical protein